MPACPHFARLLMNQKAGIDLRLFLLSEPEADRGPRAGSPRGVVVATGFLVQKDRLLPVETRSLLSGYWPNRFTDFVRLR